MAGILPSRVIVLICLIGGYTFAAAAAQVYTPPPPPLTTLPPCPVAKDAKEAKRIARRKDCDPSNRPATPAAAAPRPPESNSATQKFPYPGELTREQTGGQTGEQAGNETGTQPGKPADARAKAFPYPGDHDGEYTADPNVAHDPAAEKKAADTSAGKAFPYPGDPAPAAAPASESSSSWSSTSTSSSSDDAGSGQVPAAKAAATDDDDDDSQPKLADKGSEGKQNKKTEKSQSDSERVDEDLSVAKFYGKIGNSMGAYLRAKDAVKLEPDLAEARFLLGEAAKRLKKIDEAKAEFTEYLKLAPDGEHARAAEKAIAELP